jgi:hypothetical protein
VSADGRQGSPFCGVDCCVANGNRRRTVGWGAQTGEAAGKWHSRASETAGEVEVEAAGEAEVEAAGEPEVGLREFARPAVGVLSG